MLKFAIVREDSEVELLLMRERNLTRPLLVASGGCTALDLKAAHPRTPVTVFDLNPDQLAHIRHKAEAVERGDLALLNVENDDPGGLNQRGVFEDLFRVLRAAIVHLVTGQDALERYFAPHAPERAAMVERWVHDPFWIPAFHSAFHDPLLHAMFGPAATQHAAPGSYPAYFAGVIARGLRQEDGHRNPFLQHILLGRYLEADAPRYTRGTTLEGVTLVEGPLMAVPDLDAFDLVQLSNVFDWCDEATIQQHALHLRQLKPGAVVLMRQLNNDHSLRPFFEPDFTFDDALGSRLQQMDRSLFYNRIEVATRR